MTICCHEQQPPRQTAKPRMRAPRAPAHVTVRRAWGERLCVLFTHTHTAARNKHPRTLGRFDPLLDALGESHPHLAVLRLFANPAPWPFCPLPTLGRFDTALGHRPWTLGALEKTHRLVCLFSIAHLPLAPSSLFALFAPGPFALWPLCPWPLWPWIEHSPVYQRTSLCAAHVERAPLRPSIYTTASTHTTHHHFLCP